MGQLSSMLGIPARTEACGCPQHPSVAVTVPHPQGAPGHTQCSLMSCSPSPSMSLSQASPSPLLSVSRWSLLGTLGQLSQASPKESVSEFCWSLLGKSRQLSWREGKDRDAPIVVAGRAEPRSAMGQGRGTSPACPLRPSQSHKPRLPAAPRSSILGAPESSQSKKLCSLPSTSPGATGTSCSCSTNTSTFLMPSPSASSSHWSPMPSLSASSCPEFGVRRQLSWKHRHQ